MVGEKRQTGPSPKQEDLSATGKLRKVLTEFADAVIAVVSVDQNGDEGIGAAFHVGEGVFLTAKHVVHGKRSVKALLFAEDMQAGYPTRWHDEDAQEDVTPVYHSDPNVDVAAFQIEKYGALPEITLGGHLDDWINDRQFLLHEVLVLGFPPIPMSRAPILVAAKGEVNGVVDLQQARHVHFVLSVMARGGFSGGVVMSQHGWALGLVTESLIRNHAPEELGYLTVISVEPLYECLAQNKLLAAHQKELWGSLFEPREKPYQNQ